MSAVLDWIEPRKGSLKVIALGFATWPIAVAADRPVCCRGNECKKRRRASTASWLAICRRC